MGFVPGGGCQPPPSPILALALNRYVGIRAMAPAFASIESSVSAGFGELVGYPEAALGVFTSGASASILTAIVAAREAPLPERRLPRRHPVRLGAGSRFRSQGRQERQDFLADALRSSRSTPDTE